MRLKQTDNVLSEEKVTRDGLLDRTRSFNKTSSDDRQKAVRDGSLDRARGTAAKQTAKKLKSGLRDGSLDRARTASKKVEPNRSKVMRGGLLDDARGVEDGTSGPVERARTGRPKQKKK